MPLKFTSTFPTQYGQLSEEVGSGRRPAVRIACESHKQAIRLRFAFYTYRRLLRSEVAHGDSAKADLLSLNEAVMVLISHPAEPQQWIEFINRDESGDARLIQEALNANDQPQ